MNKSFCDNCGKEIGNTRIDLSVIPNRGMFIFSPWHNKEYPHPHGEYCSYHCAIQVLEKAETEFLSMERDNPK